MRSSSAGCAGNGQGNNRPFPTQTTLPFPTVSRSRTRSLRVLVACEFSGTVRDAFLDRGHDAWSCDLLPAENGSNRHIRGDARDVLNDGWDMLIVAHPPCTRLCNSGVRWLSVPPPGKNAEQMWAELDEGAALFSAFWNAPVDRICIENPVMHRHAKERIADFRPPAQTVQPWWFGEPFFKATGLYLRNLPTLLPTQKLTPPARGTAEHKAWSRVHRMSPGPDRGRERSRFFPGIAAAMADQWCDFAIEQFLREAA
ncbi:hypothetical protein [Sinorhizobium medicae]|uniref:hypothetical protein n=1 Tax=Sinorhizobium medicae TaxID=110321 RepID=UPI00037DDD7E|nr:hypothetical protein [Sinorhizobium medicae]MDX0408403.1 hypothetical protein [Sinorhizobium medicae]MDX0420270.1 hypothetical protein [Sinorhizobium medicae]MDX0560809.1 hypothetical protein [Sinorhizobium medicae]MDX0605384.1 hypothetical protein [Sinorhizobium medicae]MDX0663516.1 hypothetical protein [Sinorhizobium medicae]